MKKHLPPLNALKVFDMVATYQSFSRAAEANCMTKGAISQQIKILEDWFGFRLFNRSSHGIELTEIGVDVMEFCSRLFNEMELQCRAFKVRYSEVDILKIGCSSSLLSYLFLPKLDLLFKSNDRITFKFNSSATIENLYSGEIDLFITSENHSESKRTKKEILFRDEIGLVCTRQYYEDKIKNTEKLVTILHAKSRKPAWREWCNATHINIEKSSEMEFDTLALALDAVKFHLGVTIAPKFIVESQIKTGSLFAPYGFANCSSDMFLYTNGGISFHTQSLVDEISQRLRNSLTSGFVASLNKEENLSNM